MLFSERAGHAGVPGMVRKQRNIIKVKRSPAFFAVGNLQG